MSPKQPQSAKLASGFLDGVEGRDLAALRVLFHPHAIFWSNIANEERDLESRFAMIAMEFELFVEFAFAERKVNAYEDGFTIRTLIKGALAGGKTFEFPACIVGDVRDGLIERLDEYVDATPVAPILAGLAAADAG